LAINTIAFIPARAGSKGIPQKNIRLLKGYPLIAYSIIAAKLSKNIERVILSTDSEEIADIGRYYGAEVPFIRPKKYAGDLSTDIDVVKHAMRWFNEQERFVAEFWVYLRPTTPLRDPKIIDEAINKFMKSPNATSLRSGYPAPESPFKWFDMDEKGYFRPIHPENPDLAPSRDIPESYNLPRQLYKTVYIGDAYVEVIRSSYALNSELLFGEDVVGFICPQTTEIDTVEELDYIEFTIDKHGSPLLHYLKQNYSLPQTLVN